MSATLVEQLISALQNDGWQVEPPIGDAIKAIRAPRMSLSESRGTTERHSLPEQRFKLVTSTADLAGYLGALGDSGRSAFGSELPPDQANFQLMLVHLEEAVATNPIDSTFGFDGDSITVTGRMS